MALARPLPISSQAVQPQEVLEERTDAVHSQADLGFQCSPASDSATCTAVTAGGDNTSQNPTLLAGPPNAVWFT